MGFFNKEGKLTSINNKTLFWTNHCTKNGIQW